jgi:hypothetical protein
MKRQIDQNSNVMKVKSCAHQSCKCIWGSSVSYRNTSELSQKDCKRACKFCKKHTASESNRELNLNSTLIVIPVLIVILCWFATFVGYVYYFTRCRPKNNNDYRIDTMENIMLMPDPSKESEAIVANIKIEFLESYFKKTMGSIQKIDSQFYVSTVTT